MTNGNDIHPTERVSGSGAADNSGPDGDPTQEKSPFEKTGEQDALYECPYCRRQIYSVPHKAENCAEENDRETQEGIPGR